MKKTMILITGLLFLSFCASLKIINVRYELPETSGILKGKRIYISFQDQRAEEGLLGPGAKDQLKGFTGRFAFAISEKGDPGFRVGTYDVETVIKEAFKNRLESQGAIITSKRDKKAYTLLIVLKRFYIDFRNRSWHFEMSYEAKLIKDNKVFGFRTISGESERLKIMGVSQLERIMGELFTELINRLDMIEIFKKAGAV